MSKAKAAFVTWVKRNDPFLYKIALKRVRIGQRGGMGGMGGILDIFNSLSDTVQRIAPQVLELGAQKKILDIQLERAKNGLAPLQTQYQPTVSASLVNSERGERMANQIAYRQDSGMGASYIPIALAIAGVGAAYLFLKKGR